MLFSNGNKAIVIDNNTAIFTAAGRHRPVSRLHHYALKDRLTADLSESASLARGALILTFLHRYLPFIYVARTRAQSFSIIL